MPHQYPIAGFQERHQVVRRANLTRAVRRDHRAVPVATSSTRAPVDATTGATARRPTEARSGQPLETRDPMPDTAAIVGYKTSAVAR